MENLKELLKASLLSIIFFLSLTACVKDVELDQVDEIRLKPTAVIDLMDYTLEADLLAFDQQQPIAFEQDIKFKVVTDDLKESVSSVNLMFKYSNSLPRTFSATLYFITNRNRIKHIVSFEIPPGSKDSPENLIFEEIFEGGNLKALNESSRIKLQMEMQPGPGATEGQLKLQSTAAYKFEF